MKFFLQFLIALAVAGSVQAQPTGSAIISVTGTGPYQYSITLTNTGTTDIGTFWYAWTPGQNYLATSPTSVQNPSGWTSTITSGGGFAIQWVASTSPLAPGGSLPGFTFTSSDTPAEVFGNSTFFSHPPVGTSFLYGGAPFSDNGFQFVVTVPGGPPLAITTTSLPDGTNNETYSQALAATGGAGAYTWKISSGALPKGLTLTSGGLLSGKPAGGQFDFSVKVTDGSSDTATQALSLTIITPDATPPTLKITAPMSGVKLSNDMVQVTGTAKDNVAVSNVLYSVNGGAWTNAGSGNQFANWSAQVALTPGTNTITAYAVDTSGNLSSTGTVRVIYIVSDTLTARLTVQITGSGSLKQNLNGDFLVISNSYSMKATPAKGFAFYYWGGGVPMSTSPTLNFIMASNLVITADFKDITPPTLTITSPKSKARESNATVNVTGTASDNVGVTAVGVQVNNGGWMTADGTNAWSLDGQPVIRGTNIVAAYAMDAAGNFSRTNTVTFLGELPAAWAPDALTGSTLLVTPDSGYPISASFDAATFSQTDAYTNTDSGTGTYAYTNSATNLASLQITFDAPFSLSNSAPQNIQLNFTGVDTGTFSNLDSMDTGTFTIQAAAKLLPASWTGHTITATNASATTLTTIKITSKTQLTVTESGTSTVENYVVTDASPVCAMLVVTDPTSGRVTYLQLTLTSTSGGYFQVNSFDTGGIFSDGDFGVFTFKAPGGSGGGGGGGYMY